MYINCLVSLVLWLVVYVKLLNIKFYVGDVQSGLIAEEPKCLRKFYMKFSKYKSYTANQPTLEALVFKHLQNSWNLCQESEDVKFKEVI